MHHTILKSRYVLENLLIKRGNFISQLTFTDSFNELETYIEAASEGIITLDVHDPHQASAFTIFRFLRSALDLGQVRFNPLINILIVCPRSTI